MQTKPKIFGALVKAICIGWLGVFLVDIVSILLFQSSESGLDGLLQGLLGIGLAYLLIGLPIALVVGLILGLIIWNIMWALKLIGRNHAIGFGALAGLILGMPTYYLFMRDEAYLFAHLDILSTAMIGAFSGSVFYKNIYFPKDKIEETFT